MASVFKAEKGDTRYTILYYDENGKRRKKVGFTDKKETERLANKLEDEARKYKQGLNDRKAESFRDHERRPLADHIDAWQASLSAKGHTSKHAGQSTDRVRRLVAVMLGARPDDIDGKTMTREQQKEARALVTRLTAKVRLSDLTADRAQAAIATLRDSGRSLLTCNHYRACARAFMQWAWKDSRVRDNPMIALEGYNAKEDPRHQRRTISVEELRALISAAEHGPVVMGMTGHARALCYQLAAASGLRHGFQHGQPRKELASITSESFDWEANQLTIPAG
jgi:hypothetical protein